jgi:putative NADPH-quinone reductase
MVRRVAVIQGHPDPRGIHYCNALADAYAAGARGEGHEVRIIDVSRMDFALLRTAEEVRDAPPPAEIQDAQDTIRWADHLVFVYPLWLGTLPALLKGFLEQAFRENFAFSVESCSKGRWKRLLKGKSARIVVTMGMPAMVYRVWFGAHGLKSFERNILAFAGIGPIRETLIGMVESRSQESRGRWLVRMQELGRAAR